MFSTVLRNLLLGIPPALVSFLKMKFESQQVVSTRLQEYAQSWFDGWPFFALLWAPSIINVIFDLLNYIRKSREKESHPEAAKVILASFNEIVALKLQRFSDCCLQKHDDPFIKITQPEDQIREIVKQLHATLSSILEISDIKVVLATVEGNSLTGKMVFAPNSASPGLKKDDIKGGTFFHSVISSKKAISIDSLMAFYKRRTKTKKSVNGVNYKFQNNEPEEGSIVGLPIISRDGTIAYILTIKSEKLIFGKKFIKAFKNYLEMYKMRILLESALYRIKDDYCIRMTNPQAEAVQDV